MTDENQLKSSDVPNCQYCGAERNFEFQVDAFLSCHRLFMFCSEIGCFELELPLLWRLKDLFLFLFLKHYVCIWFNVVKYLFIKV